METEQVETIYEATEADAQRFVTVHSGPLGDRVCFGLYTAAGPMAWLTVAYSPNQGPYAVLQGVDPTGTFRGPELLAQTLLAAYGRLGLGAVFDGLGAWLESR